MSNNHHHAADTKGRNLLITLLLNLVITVVEFVGGILSNSPALLSDAIHNLRHTLAIGLAYVADKMSKSKPMQIVHLGINV